VKKGLVVTNPRPVNFSLRDDVDPFQWLSRVRIDNLPAYFLGRICKLRASL